MGTATATGTGGTVPQPLTPRRWTTWIVPQSEVSSLPVSRPMPLLATTVAQSRSGTATATYVTTVGTAWDVADGSARLLRSAPWSSEGPGCFFFLTSASSVESRRPEARAFGTLNAIEQDDERSERR